MLACWCGTATTADHDRKVELSYPSVQLERVSHIYDVAGGSLALATRYDKLAITYRAAVVLSACITWTRT